MSVDVYLISRVEWQGLGGSYVGAAPRFKIGYSTNPFERLEQLKQGTGHNLVLWAVVLCSDEAGAQRAERQCHAALQPFRRRGEWFECPVDQAWSTIHALYPGSSTQLTDRYLVDLDTMTLVPPAPGAWCGIADDYHDYRAYKLDGVLQGRFEAMPDPQPWARELSDPNGSGLQL